ncbi:MAG: transcription initiation factor IIB family protein, partial [Terriglobus roseus]|nr:transcription initiation factor IIB family protein [Terriglobus roseus]
MARVLSPGEVPVGPALGHGGDEWHENLNIALICRDCKENPPNIVEDSSAGTLICGSCGLVLMDHVVDTRSEWRTFSNDDGKDVDPSRVGDAANPLLNGDQLHTRVAAGGNQSSRELQRAQGKSAGDKTAKGLLEAYDKIGSLCEAMHCPKNVSDTAKHIYKILDDARAFKGKSQDALVASCIFIACRKSNVPRSFREITDMTRVPKKEIGRTFKAVEKFLQDHQKKNIINTGGLTISNDDYKTTESSKAPDLCRRFCSQLGLSQQISAVTSSDPTSLTPTISQRR